MKAKTKTKAKAKAKTIFEGAWAQGPQAAPSKIILALALALVLVFGFGFGFGLPGSYSKSFFLVLMAGVHENAPRIRTAQF